MKQRSEKTLCVDRIVHLTWEADERRSSKDGAEGKGQAMQQKLFIETSVLQKREKTQIQSSGAQRGEARKENT